MAKKKTKDSIETAESLDTKELEVKKGKKVKAEPVAAEEKAAKKATKAKKEPKADENAAEKKASKKVSAKDKSKTEKPAAEKKTTKKTAKTKKTKSKDESPSTPLPDEKIEAVKDAESEEEVSSDNKKRGRQRKEKETEPKKEKAKEVKEKKAKEETEKKATPVEEVIPVKDERPFVQTELSKKQEEERAAEQAFIESADIQPMPDVRYADEDLKIFEKRILDYRKESIDELRMLRDRLDDLTNYDFAEESMIYSMHMAEQGSEALEKEKTYAQIQRINEYIKKLDDALQRIKEKTYGICRVCGCLIAKERLLAVPITTLSASYKIHKKCPDDGIDRIEQPKQNNESNE